MVRVLVVSAPFLAQRLERWLVGDEASSMVLRPIWPSRLGARRMSNPALNVTAKATQCRSQFESLPRWQRAPTATLTSVCLRVANFPKPVNLL